MQPWFYFIVSRSIRCIQYAAHTGPPSAKECKNKLTYTQRFAKWKVDDANISFFKLCSCVCTLRQNHPSPLFPTKSEYVSGQFPNGALHDSLLNLDIWRPAPLRQGNGLSAATPPPIAQRPRTLPLGCGVFATIPGRGLND